MRRIPDVGNPWLDAGIVPFSTLQYRNNPDYWRKWYPADWISESFPGQFRNWFYSLLAMATVVDNSPPFLENFSYASLLAEDGKEMHKSWGNAIEFNEAADKMGVDVMRWLYCSQKPENNLLFGYQRAEETRRRFLIPLWNVYSFFATYANLDKWEPQITPFDPGSPEGPTPRSNNPLDLWILARLNQVVANVTKALEDSDAFGATITVESLIDDLTNWYVRRSRRRFWKSEYDEDKNTAYATLYHVLIKLIKTLAPLVPFVTEEMYQNLVRNIHPDSYESVHHTNYPQTDEKVIDEQLIEQMALARRIASLGLSARSSANIKVRQPLSKVFVYVSEGKAELNDELIAIVSDELNVKAFEFVDNAKQLVNYKILPNNKLLGPRFGSMFPKVRTALNTLDPLNTAQKVEGGENTSLEIDDETITLSPEEILVETQPIEGLAIAAQTLTLKTELKPITRLMKISQMFLLHGANISKPKL